MNYLSKNIRLLLSKAKLSENELSRRTGIAQQVINRLLSGINQNPKLSTLKPLANYFNISLSQLVGEESISSDLLRKVPLLDWDLIRQHPLSDLLTNTSNYIGIDIALDDDLFATTLPDVSMDPKFSANTLLIFAKNKQPVTGDFILLLNQEKNLQLRQIIIHNKVSYKKCFNPDFSEYVPKCIEPTEFVLACLVQSRTDYNLRKA